MKTAIIAGLVAYTLASPFITLKQTEIAVKNKDVATLKKTIDFESVKNSFSAQMIKEMAEDKNSSGFAAIGAMIGISVLDNIITPEVLVSFMSEGAESNIQGSVRDKVTGLDNVVGGLHNKKLVDVKILSINTMIMTMRSSDKDIDVILGRDIINWRITGFNIK